MFRKALGVKTAFPFAGGREKGVVRVALESGTMSEGTECESKARVVVLVSGSGTNLQALIDADQHDYDIVAVVSNRKAAHGLVRAEKAGIPTLYSSLKSFKDKGLTRTDYDVELAKTIRDTYRPDIIMLAGWMHIVSAEFLAVVESKVINLHPALPKEFDGVDAIGRAFAAFKEGLTTRTGVMIHRVTPVVDRGEVLLTEEVPIRDDDVLETLAERMHAAEHRLIVAAVSTEARRIVASR